MKTHNEEKDNLFDEKMKNKAIINKFEELKNQIDDVVICFDKDK